MPGGVEGLVGRSTSQATPPFDLLAIDSSDIDSEAINRLEAENQK